MLVWVNGAFGSGKTTLVRELRARLPEALVFDPEEVGVLLASIVEVPTGDFQDLRQWRRQVATLAAGLVEEYRRPLLVPMTLVQPAYRAEIFSALERAGVELLHVFLDVPLEVLVRRIQGRTPPHGRSTEQAFGWVMSKLPACIAAVDTLPAGTLVLDGELPTAALADAVLARMGGRAAGEPAADGRTADGEAADLSRRTSLPR